MKAKYFPEVNQEIAKDQPQYNTLPAHVSDDGVVVCCFKLDDSEIENVNKYGLIWIHIIKGNQQLQPFSLFATRNYFSTVARNGLNFIVGDEDAADKAVKELVQPKSEHETEIDVGAQYKFYLKKMGLNEKLMNPVQKVETKRAFYGGVGQALMLLRDIVGNMESDDLAMKAFDGLLRETSEFWNTQK